MTAPFLTIQKAVDTVSGGNTIFVRAGTYNERVTFWGKSGTESAPTVLSAYPGERPVIDGAGVYSGEGGAVVMVWDSYVRVSGFEVKNGVQAGMVTSNKGHNIFSHNIVHDVQQAGIGLGGDYDIAEYNEAYNTAMSNFEVPGSVINATGISARRAPNYAVIRHNIVHDGWGEGISSFEATHTLIEDNIIYDNWSNNVYISDSTDVILRRNFIYQTKNMDKVSAACPNQLCKAGQTGIELGDERMTPRSTRNMVVNNIVYGCKRNLYAWSNGTSGMDNLLIANNTFVNSSRFANIQLGPTSNVNVSIKNNIFIQNGGLLPIFLENKNGITFSNNFWSSTPNSLASGPGDIIGDAKLVNISNPYAAASYALTSTSPAINAGASLGLNTDFYNKPLVGLPDMGAIEY